MADQSGEMAKWMDHARESAGIGVWAWDLSENIFHWDKVVGKIVRSKRIGPASDSMEQVLRHAIHPDDQECMWQSALAAVEQNGEFHAECRLLRCDGEILWARFDGKSACDRFGAPLRLVGAVHDITESRDARERLKQSIRVRDEVISVASHELKTPISALSMHLQLAKRMIDQARGAAIPVETLVRCFSVCSELVTRVVTLVDDLLDTARVDAGKLEFRFGATNLSDLVHRSLERLAENVRIAKCTISTQVEAGVTGSWDGSRLDQVITNLISNAIKYGAGAPVSVRLRNRDGWAELEVEDGGVGIPRDMRDIVFERYQRLQSRVRAGGLGLGLYIAREIVRAHGGQIAVESEPGQGSCFRVLLPCSQASQQGAA